MFGNFLHFPLNRFWFLLSFIYQTRLEPSSSVRHTFYDPSVPSPGDDFVLVSLEEASMDVDKALNNTVAALLGQNANARNATPAHLLRVFR